MPRPRFHKLDAEKRGRILLEAAQEFGSKGFAGASFNKIIEAAGISKGAAYHYFDDKEDLFSTVVEHAVGSLAEWFSEFDMASLTPDNFWQVLEAYTVQNMRRLKAHPTLSNLLRTTWTFALSHDSAARRGLMRAATKWAREFITRGRALGVVRDDLPLELMVEMYMGLGVAIDQWALGHMDDIQDVERYSQQVTDAFRRLSAPDPVAPGAAKTANKSAKPPKRHKKEGV